MFSNVYNSGERVFTNLKPEMVEESCYAFISLWNQNKDQEEVVFNVTVSESDMDFHAFILYSGGYNGGYNGGFPTTLVGSDADGNWTHTGNVNMYGLENSEYKTHSAFKNILVGLRNLVIFGPNFFGADRTRIFERTV